MVENNYNKKIAEIEPIDSQEVLGASTEYVIVKSRDDLRKIVEEPCIAACLYLYDKNIFTINSSANKQNIGNNGTIGIHYDSLSEENKEVVKQLAKDGIVDGKVAGSEERRRKTDHYRGPNNF